MSTILHITNGGSLTQYLRDLEFKDPILSWGEMLCEGPTSYYLESRSFFRQRKAYLSSQYDIDIDLKECMYELNKLNNPEQYSHIVLWFEYDLFCHINMLAVINLILQRGISKSIYLVCSGRVNGETNLKGLTELSRDQLLQHYNNKVLLKDKDFELTKTLWGIYCGKDHNLFKSYIVKKSSFEYLGNCLKAHLMRFADSITGLGTIETNILKLINKFDIKSRHHLLGYALNYQGYYGYGDLQYERVIQNLEPFIEETLQGIQLNALGKKILEGQEIAKSYINNSIAYGGVKRSDFSFDKGKNKLIPNF